MKIVYHDWDRAVKRSDDIFGSVLRYKRHELDSCSTDYPVWLLCAFFSERLWLVLRIRVSRRQNLHGQLAHTQVLAFCIETPHPASKAQGAQVSGESHPGPGSG
jgi:hypothetical protein